MGLIWSRNSCGAKSSDFSRLQTRVLQFMGREEINNYVVRTFRMKVSDKGELNIEVVLGRRLLTVVLTTILSPQSSLTSSAMLQTTSRPSSLKLLSLST